MNWRFYKNIEVIIAFFLNLILELNTKLEMKKTYLIEELL